MSKTTEEERQLLEHGAGLPESDSSAIAKTQVSYAIDKKAKFKSLPSMEDLHIPAPADMLPSMVDVGWKLVEFKKEDPSLFMVRGERTFEQTWNVEVDQAMLEKAIMELIEGKSWTDSVRRLSYLFWHKSQLIQTVGALEYYRQRVQVIDNDIGKLIWGDRKAYTRQGLSENISHSVAAKLNQVLFFMVYVSHGTPGSYDPHKGIVMAPDPRLKNKARVPEELLDTFGAFFEDDVTMDAGVTLPMHPDWLSHDIPLCETVWFEDCFFETKRALNSEQAGDACVVMNQISFYKTLLTRIEGALRSQLDMVSTMQQKVLGLMMTIALASLNYFRHQIEFDDLQHLHLNNMNITGYIHT